MENCTLSHILLAAAVAVTICSCRTASPDGPDASHQRAIAPVGRIEDLVPSTTPLEDEWDPHGWCSKDGERLQGQTDLLYQIREFFSLDPKVSGCYVLADQGVPNDADKRLMSFIPDLAELTIALQKRQQMNPRSPRGLRFYLHCGFTSNTRRWPMLATDARISATFAVVPEKNGFVLNMCKDDQELLDLIHAAQRKLTQEGS